MSDEGASNNEQLLAACKLDQSDMVEDLLKDLGSVDVNCADGVGNTPLHYANSAQTGSVDCVELLVAVPGIDANKKNRIENDTPLHKASLEITRLLISAGADPRIVNRLKQRPMDATLAFNMPHQQAVYEDGDDYSSD
ncbi:hypothetical protein DL89DRAFT_295525 [Linderina pennispora]|uniref:Uncharacterized protein n=1 Tax=Linderina pennispora TaxID=61395 RepID=A0A1Y1VYC2_9FUNG|nr:uncharacterized protein DL89DRAFT_295525 [Linderina pennispora]ORX66270.1 hypothetical protein DL89DRAFT_295525 [Linderina pennispora]